MKVSLILNEDQELKLNRFCSRRGLELAEFFHLAIDLADYAEKRFPWAVTRVLNEAKKQKGE